MKRHILPALLLIAPLSLLAAEGPAVKTLVWPDGTRYVGGVVDGKRSGKGTIFWEDGTRFVGTFEDDKRNGPGTMILPDGTVYTGYFRNDELVEPPEERADDAGAEVGPEAEAQATPPSDERIASAPEPEAMQPADEPPARTRQPMIERVTEIDDDVRSQLRNTIDLWAAAWSEQNVPQYLDYYSSDFEVPRGYSSRSRWESVRKDRLTRPDFIDLKVVYEDFELIEPDVVDVTFKQTYDSDVYGDVETKTLRLRKEGPAWKILLERTR